jgi:hypothetical protein
MHCFRDRIGEYVFFGKIDEQTMAQLQYCQRMAIIFSCPALNLALILESSLSARPYIFPKELSEQYFGGAGLAAEASPRLYPIEFSF